MFPQLSGLFIDLESIVKGPDGEVGKLDLVLHAPVDQPSYFPGEKNVNRQLLGNGAGTIEIVVGNIEGVLGRGLCAMIEFCRHTAQSDQPL